MQTMTNYPGVLLRALAGAGAVVGLVAALADAAVAAPAASVTITERTADVARQTPKAPKVMADVKPSTFILDTAARRLRQQAQKDAAGKGAAKTTAVPARIAAKPAAWKPVATKASGTPAQRGDVSKATVAKSASP